MLHAFNAGRRIAGNTLGPRDFSPDKVYDMGDGREEWAFVLPDMLAKLRLALDEHHLFVDGTPMVRDVWVDSSGDGVKQKDEYHTIAVIAGRGGGTKYTALDVTDPLALKGGSALASSTGPQAVNQPFR